MFLSPGKNIFCFQAAKFVYAQHVSHAAKLGNICIRNNVSATMFLSLARPLVLPWKSKFCRGKVSFAVADVGHRTKKKHDRILVKVLCMSRNFFNADEKKQSRSHSVRNIYFNSKRTDCQ